MMTFTTAELEYLRSQPTARLATVSPDGQPDVVPVAAEFDGSTFWVGGQLPSFPRTRKILNVAAGNHKVALVIDDMVSLDPFVVRGIRIYGTAGDLVERSGMVGPGVYLPITPLVSWSWNMAGEPVGDSWYPSPRTVHSAKG